MATLKESKDALDKIIKKSRVHLYKPIQIAEILYRHRTTRDVDINDLETFRNPSKKWRDEVTIELVGRISTSSAKFQDNLFESNAMPIRYLEKLSEENKTKRGIVENYIYHCLEKRLTMVAEAREFIKKSAVENFSLKDFLNLFAHKPGLKRSIDKAYEITVYAFLSQ